MTASLGSWVGGHVYFEVTRGDPLAIAYRTAMAMDQNPFKNTDAWRRHPLLNNTWKHGAPGFFIGLAAFSAFYAYDKATSRKTAKH